MTDSLIYNKYEEDFLLMINFVSGKEEIKIDHVLLFFKVFSS